MTMTEVVAVCESIGIAPHASPLGVRIGTSGWRIECGSGIAGNGGTWWVRLIAGVYDPGAPDAKAKPLGPATTAAELRAILLGQMEEPARQQPRSRRVGADPGGWPVKVWCVQHREGWCATFRGQQPSESASSDRAACGYYVILRIGSERRHPTCAACKKVIARRRSPRGSR